MESTKALFHNTKLKDRTLWFDGQSSFNSERLIDDIQRYDIQFVDIITDIVKEYNKHQIIESQIKVKTTCDELAYNWVIPEEYKSLDVVEYLTNKHLKLTSNMPVAEIDAREERLATELTLYKHRNLFDILRTIIYIINTLTINDVVWGVGRGSSVSSYVLYVLQVHDVDSFAYQLNIDDFLHD